ncbi:hypothetical protein HMPREF2708_10635 [Corynebacterium sp. HMSC073H12]|uniref:helix-turn-helix transcriptional regulator n=1 Tax=Corynebacterium sp. HMSC073H12 TaxID=1715187 RepID=UPI0008A986E0|nr:helix-turn-helix domain-containing protein [Corynebacterium sp. HMSC073H12]OHQ78538.1 hypothetical protein HMPREF2708_10635 [Corynebacterium sp. HMSC073H12]
MKLLGNAMKQRRLALNLTQSDVAELAGVTVRTVGKLERSEATKVKALTAAGIERALQWEPGSLDAIKNGGGPTELQQPPETPPVVKQPLPQPGATDGVGELRQAIRDLDSLPGYVQRVVLDQAVDELPRAIAALDDERRGRLVRYTFALWDEMGGMASSALRLAVTLGDGTRVWEFCGDGRWVMIRSLYAEPGHAPFPDRAGGPMPSTMIEERFGVLQELPLEVVAQIEQESVGRRIGSAEILSTFHDSTKNPTRETDVGDLRTMHDGKAHDDALDATVFEFPGPESAPADTHLDYVAKRGTPEPEEGDDDYGDGA